MNRYYFIVNFTVVLLGFFVFTASSFSASSGGGSCSGECSQGMSELACVGGQRCERWCNDGPYLCGINDYWFWSEYACAGSCSGGGSSPCGDGFCDAVIGENNSTCPSDCPPTDPCAGGPRSDCGWGGGWFCCGSGMMCVGSPSSFSCAPASAPTPTLPPPTCGGVPPGEFVSGTYCTSATTCYDLYCNSSGTGTEPRNYSGATCSFCAPPPGPTSAPTSAPPPPSGGGGSCPGSCASSSLLGTACSGGTWSPMGGTCVSGTCMFCDAGAGGGGSCPSCGLGTCCAPGFCVDAGASGADASDYCLIIPVFPPPVCGDGVCNGTETCSTCSGDCGVCTYSISGKVFVDSNGNGIQNCSGSCNNGSGDELNYNGATVSRSGGGGSTSTNSSGNYSFNNVSAGSYNLSLSVPGGYISTTTNPRSAILGPDATNINFGIRQAPPACVPGSVSINPSGGTVNPGSSVTLSVTSCTNVENPDNGTPPPPFTWDPDTNGNSPAPSLGSSTNTPTSSTIPWTAPSCPIDASGTETYAPQVTVGGPGGTTNYTTTINVPATWTIGVNVRSVTSASSCLPTDGSAYQDSGTGATVNVVNTSGSYTINQNQVTTTAVPGTSFACLPSATNYQLSLQPIPGYSIVGVNNNGTQTFPGSSPVNITNLNSSRTVTFCIAPIDPWFQTTTGDVRFLNLSNPVPSGLFASSDPTYPGIFYSSGSVADFGNSGAAGSSARQWIINNEYSYNSNTRNRNGGMSYDFYKNKALQDGVNVEELTPGVLNQSEITGNGVYEANGNLTINSYTHVSGRRVVILVNGNVTINSNISVPVGQGLLIVAAKQNITIATGVGAPTTNSTATNLDGIYTAQGSVILPSVDNGCQTLVPDIRLNVGGALIANSLKPFAASGNSIQNNRSLCVDNLLYPALYVVQRPDFLIQLTDFYKTSYTKWREVNP